MFKFKNHALKKVFKLKTMHLKRCLTVFIKSVKRVIKNRFNTFLKRCLTLHSNATDVATPVVRTTVPLVVVVVVLGGSQ